MCIKYIYTLHIPDFRLPYETDRIIYTNSGPVIRAQLLQWSPSFIKDLPFQLSLPVMLQR